MEEFYQAIKQYCDSRAELNHLFATKSPSERCTKYRNDIIMLNKAIQDSLTSIHSLMNKKIVRLEDIKEKIDDRDLLVLLSKFDGGLNQSTAFISKSENSGITNCILKEEGETDIWQYKSLFYPLIYQIPDKNAIVNRTSEYYNELKSSIYDKEKLRQIHDSFLVIAHNSANLDDWMIVFEALVQSLELTRQKHEVFKDSYLNLKENVSSPFYAFLTEFENAFEKFEFSNIKKEFISILIEVSRDNIITEKERMYLFQKAKEFNIRNEEFNYLINNKFIAYPSFHLLVSEVCVDGLVTETEYGYLREKSKQYNIKEEILSEMISEELRKFKIFESYKNKDDFFQLLLIYYLLLFVDNKSESVFKLGNILNNILKNNNSNAINLTTQVPIFSELLRLEINRKIGHQLIPKNYSVDKIYPLFDLRIPDYKSIQDPKEVKRNKSIHLTNFLNYSDFPPENRWHVRIDPLMGSNLKIDTRSKEIIFRNRSNLNEQELFEAFVSNLFYNWSFHRSRETDLLFENLEHFYGKSR